MAKPKPDDKEQSKRFIEKARELEADESGESFERALKRLARPRGHRKGISRKERSGT